MRVRELRKTVNDGRQCEWSAHGLTLKWTPRNGADWTIPNPLDIIFCTSSLGWLRASSRR